ncbi:MULTISPECIES: hypothetical protein [unclassified Gemella]|uniref:hypothetical protein n=1 Tax=unclassified Gemella TaxID=2624949 RepID=UPI001C054365|nr:MULTISPECIES: hypothetical protein [unclassified Gemella]MBU0279073.1 hypothetical protein [Gemella sp. zg-1178]QWQ39121.1 hypothetical protein KMP11_01955 [Gemella sp. zg-570]
MTKLIVTEEHATKELRKFFTLLKVEGVDLKMPNTYMDEVWHHMLEDDKEYKEFCLETAGAYIEHVPNKAKFPEELAWVKLYENKFGKLDISWFVTGEGNFQEKEYEEYIKTGVLKMSWDCSAIIEDM